MAFFNGLKRLTSLSKLQYAAAIGSVCAIPLGVRYLNNKSEMLKKNQALQALSPICGIPGCWCEEEDHGQNQIRVLKKGRDEGKLWGKSEDEKAIYLRLECPGIDQQHFQVTHEGNGCLLMIGEAPNESGDVEDKIMYSGVLHLPPTKYDLDSITSHVKDGVAYVVIPKKYSSLRIRLK